MSTTPLYDVKFIKEHIHLAKLLNPDEVYVLKSILSGKLNQADVDKYKEPIIRGLYTGDRYVYLVVIDNKEVYHLSPLGFRVIQAYKFLDK